MPWEMLKFELIGFIAVVSIAMLQTSCIRDEFDVSQKAEMEQPFSSKFRTRSSGQDEWPREWAYSNFRRLGESTFFLDSYGNILYDYDNDGVPDSVWIPPVGVPAGQGGIPPEYEDEWNGGNWQNSGAPYLNSIGKVVVPPYTSGGSSSGSGLGPGTQAPMASRILHNPTMPTSQWKQIECMVSKMLEHKLAASLYKNLIVKLSNRTIRIDYDGASKSSYFKINEGRIVLNNLNHLYADARTFSRFSSIQ